MYIYIRLPIKRDVLTRATVLTVHESDVDLQLDDGTHILCWRSAMYDENGEEVSLETVKRDFLPTDAASLMARIAQLEAMVTGGGTNV